MNIEWNDLNEYAQGKADRQTRLRVEQWLDESAANRSYFSKIANYIRDPEAAADQNALVRKSHHNADRIVNRKRRVALWSSAAAAVAAVVAVTILVTSPNLNAPQQPTLQYAVEQLPSDGIVIKTDDGRSFEIDRIAQGKDSVANTHLKLDEKLLSYDNTPAKAAVEYHTIVVPRSRIFKLELSDGTSVVLNSGSSLRYPTVFAADAPRNVELTGEAYFEVTHDEQRPFSVVTTDSRVSVYGTRFLVNAYNNAPSSTLLVEGSVGVTVDNSTHRLTPGQLLTVDQGGVLIERTNPANFLSWINGYFTFEDMPISRIAASLMQWYGVDIDVDPAASNRLFNCNMPCFSNLETVLEVLADTHRMNYRAVESGYMIW